MSDTAEVIAALVDRIAGQLAELDTLQELDEPDGRRPGVTSEQLAAFEARAGVELPEDYRAFLRLHDGWEAWNGESSLLSLEEMSGGELFGYLQELQSELARVGDSAGSQGLIFEASYGMTRVSYFDLEAKQRTGVLEVVFWQQGKVVERYPSFTAFLEGYSHTLDELIVQERAQLR